MEADDTRQDNTTMVVEQVRSVYKTTLCAHHKKGTCELGVNCNFAHGNRELRSFENPLYKAQLCTAYEQGGVCQMGTDCLFAHGEDELRSDDIPVISNGNGVSAEHVNGHNGTAVIAVKDAKEKKEVFKSALCIHFAKHSSCHMGDNCTFAHGKDDLVNISRPDSNDPKYKTKLCLRFAQDNFCPSGDYCVFAHGESELKTPTDDSKKSPLFKTTLCHNFSTLGVCPSGKNCAFAHGRYELRPAGFDGDFDAKIQENPRWKCSLCKNFSQTGRCNKINCDFAHGEQELRSEHADNPRVLRSNYKTVMCNNWANAGYCFHEDTCSFAHGDEELQRFTGSKDVASALKLIRGGQNGGLRKRPTTAMSQTAGAGVGMSTPMAGSMNGSAVNGTGNADHKLFAEFLEFKKFKEQTEGSSLASRLGMQQQSQQNGAAVMVNPSTTGYDPIKVLNSATGRQVAVTELMGSRNQTMANGNASMNGGGGFMRSNGTSERRLNGRTRNSTLGMSNGMYNTVDSFSTFDKPHQEMEHSFAY